MKRTDLKLIWQIIVILFIFTAITFASHYDYTSQKEDKSSDSIEIETMNNNFYNAHPDAE